MPFMEYSYCFTWYFKGIKKEIVMKKETLEEAKYNCEACQGKGYLDETDGHDYGKVVCPVCVNDKESKQETLEYASIIEKIAMDKLKSKWEHLYTFGYPQEPFPKNYENDLNNIKVGLYEGAKWQAKRMYSKEEVIAIVEKSRATGLTAEYLLLTEQFKKK